MQYLAVANWGLGRTKEALSQAQIATTLDDRLVGSLKGPNRGFMLLYHSLVVMDLAPIGGEQILRLARTAMDEHVSDSFLAGLLNASDIDFPPDQVKKLFAPEQTITKWPLSYSVIMIDSEKYAEARKVLTRTKCADPLSEIHRLC